MNLEAGKAIVRQFIERSFGAGDLAAVAELIAPDAVFHAHRLGVDPPAGMRSAIERSRRRTRG